MGIILVPCKHKVYFLVLVLVSRSHLQYERNRLQVKSLKVQAGRTLKSKPIINICDHKNEQFLVD